MKCPIQKEIELCSSLFKILMSCYAAGMIDARDVDDEDLYESFSHEVSIPGVFGRINDYNRYDINGWKINILQMMNYGVNNKTKDFLMSMEVSKKKYLNCLFPISQEFYLNGIRDYYSNPTITDFMQFSFGKMIMWSKKGVEKVSRRDMLIMIQKYALKRSIIDEENKNKHSFRKVMYEKFARLIWVSITKREFV